MLGLLAGTALALAACTGSKAPEPLTISEVTVDADLPAVGSREAVAYWQHLSDDLKTAIAAQYVGRLDPAGKKIDVDIDEISLRSPFASGATAETAKLSGRVTLINPDGTNAAAYDVSATSQDIAPYLPPGSNLAGVPPTSAEYYRAIVQAFAKGTANVLNAAPAAGS